MSGKCVAGFLSLRAQVLLQLKACCVDKLIRVKFVTAQSPHIFVGDFGELKYGKYGWIDIGRTIKALRIMWLVCQLCRYSFPTKKVTFSKIEVTKRRGRSPTLWLDVVEKDLRH
ncbi:hypothetical protein TNCV_3095151 [Trichonephila clavipes]|nr:hypothetical protein TNCV_3095151 [Trichonephila clavipes]